MITMPRKPLLDESKWEPETPDLIDDDHEAVELTPEAIRVLYARLPLRVSGVGLAQFEFDDGSGKHRVRTNDGRFVLHKSLIQRLRNIQRPDETISDVLLRAFEAANGRK